MGAAIVRAAVDWQRAGLVRPVPIQMLELLHLAYLPHTPIDPGDREGQEFAAGLNWATERRTRSEPGDAEGQAEGDGQTVGGICWIAPVTMARRVAMPDGSEPLSGIDWSKVFTAVTTLETTDASVA